MRTAAVLLATMVLVVSGAFVGSRLARAANGGTDVVYIATGNNFPDALAAGPVAGIRHGPVLLVQSNSIPQVTLDELNRLQPAQIVIVGGTGVVSTAVENQLKALAFAPTVTRLGGANRYETAALISSSTFPVVPKTGAASCHAAGFFPPSDTDPFYLTPASILLRSSNGPFTQMICPVSIPHGATVTKLSAGLNDSSVGNDTLCRLFRLDVTGGSFGLGMGLSVLMAQTTATTGSFGLQPVSTTSITAPVVNNARYAYAIICDAGVTGTLGIVGATVEYTLP